MSGSLWQLHRRFRACEADSHDVFESLCRVLDVRAVLLWSDAVTVPFTFGASPARVVLPRSLQASDAATLRAVLTHELLHVARHDWFAVLIEEIWCTVCWFHPATWIAIYELRQAREEVVDLQTIQRIGERRTYVNALLSFAEGRDATTGLAFLRGNQLARRISVLAREVPMSRLRKTLSALGVAIVCAISLVATARAHPMPSLVRQGAGEIVNVSVSSAQILASPVDLVSSRLVSDHQGARIAVHVVNTSDKSVASYSLAAFPFIVGLRHGFTGRLVEVRDGLAPNSEQDAALAVAPPGSKGIFGKSDAVGGIVVIVNGVWFQDGSVWKPAMQDIAAAVDGAAKDSGFEAR